jgi:hypothetical protein
MTRVSARESTGATRDAVRHRDPMRSDIVPGAPFPDSELPDHTGAA